MRKGADADRGRAGRRLGRQDGGHPRRIVTKRHARPGKMVVIPCAYWTLRLVREVRPQTDELSSMRVCPQAVTRENSLRVGARRGFVNRAGPRFTNPCEE